MIWVPHEPLIHKTQILTSLSKLLDDAEYSLKLHTTALILPTEVT